MPEPGVGVFSARVRSDTENSGQDANNIALEDGHRPVESDAANRACRIAPDAGQCEDIMEIRRKSSAVLRNDLFRGLLEVADARVIAETFPKFMQLGGRGVGGGFDGGQLAHPALPIRYDRFDLRLLEHDLGNPDDIGIARTPPRKVAGICRKPTEQR